MSREAGVRAVGDGTGAGRATGRGGLTLIEVLMATAILGAAMAMLLTAASRCLAAMKIARNVQIAHWTFSMGELEHPLIATNEVEALEVWPVEYADGFFFEREAERDAETRDEDDRGFLYIVRTRVRWSERSRELAEEVVGYVYVRDEEQRDGARRPELRPQRPDER